MAVFKRGAERLLGLWMESPRVVLRESSCTCGEHSVWKQVWPLLNVFLLSTGGAGGGEVKVRAIPMPPMLRCGSVSPNSTLCSQPDRQPASRCYWARCCLSLCSNVLWSQTDIHMCLYGPWDVICAWSGLSHWLRRSPACWAKSKRWFHWYLMTVLYKWFVLAAGFVTSFSFFSSLSSHTHSLSPSSVCVSFSLSVFVCLSFFSCECHGPFTGSVLCERRLWASGEQRGSPVGVRVPEPPCVFLPWVAGRRCWSSCCCFWRPLPRLPPRRPSPPATRLVVQREGAGTSGREREQPGEGAGEGGCG